MIDDFNIPQAEDSQVVYSNPFNGYTPSIETKKVKKPKGKKGLRKALDQAERERNQLLYQNGRLSMENDMMKRGIALSIAASRCQLDEEVATNTLRLLPPKRKNGR